MKLSIRKGFSFGLTSGIITTLGLIIGLNAGTGSRLVVIGGILVIAVADALSDAAGMHVSEEAEAKHTDKSIWESTIATLFSKFIFALTFMVPILLFELSTAVVVSIIWGLALISIVSFYIAKKEKVKPVRVVAEHLILTVIVIIATHLIGTLVAAFFS
jgi:VIT1/CCC1 family predicted Fe2+/Mn2+ transporter